MQRVEGRRRADLGRADERLPDVAHLAHHVRHLPQVGRHRPDLHGLAGKSVFLCACSMQNLGLKLYVLACCCCIRPHGRNYICRSRNDSNPRIRDLRYTTFHARVSYTSIHVSPEPSTLRGILAKDRYDFNSSAASCSRSGFYTSYGSHVCPLSYGIL